MNLENVPWWIGFLTVWAVFILFLIFHQPPGYWPGVWQALKDKWNGQAVDLWSALDPKFSLAHQTVILQVSLMTFGITLLQLIEYVRGYPVDRLWYELGGIGTGIFTMVWFVNNLLKPPRPPRKKPAQGKLATASER